MPPATWIIVGATCGIGLEFVRQLLHRGERVIATARSTSKASQLWTLTASAAAPGWRSWCRLLECDVTVDESINRFVEDVVAMRDVQQVDYVVLNAGILKYPNRATEVSFDDFDNHLKTNTIGPILVAQKLLMRSGVPVGTIVFMSSDSGSAGKFLAFEDGFAAYAASKAALNQALRHMNAELRRKNSITSIIAMHPGEVATDLADIPLGWGVEGVMSPEESVLGMLRVISTKTIHDSGTFWTWEGKEHPW